jgi:hypothetical protein
MLELKIKEISNHSTDVNIREISEDERKELKLLEKLGFKSTPKYEKLEKLKHETELNNENKSLEPIIKDCEKNGFKILPKKFIESFLEKYNLEEGSTVEYVYDIPTVNLKNIYNKIESFVRYCHNRKLLKTFSGMYGTHNWHEFESKGEDLTIHTTERLTILAPKEHFNRDLKVEDPDPVAILHISENHCLYLDAWDLEKVMFDNDTGNPELLN